MLAKSDLLYDRILPKLNAPGCVRTLCLCTLCPYLKSCHRNDTRLRRDRSLDTQARQTTPHHARGEIQKRLRPRNGIRVPAQPGIHYATAATTAIHSGRRRSYRVVLSVCVLFRVKGHACEGLEGVVREDVDAAVICF